MCGNLAKKRVEYAEDHRKAHQTKPYTNRFFTLSLNSKVDFLSYRFDRLVYLDVLLLLMILVNILDFIRCDFEGRFGVSSLDTYCRTQRL